MPVPVAYRQYNLCICIEPHVSCPGFLTECWGSARKYCSTVNTPFTQKTDYYWKKLPQDNNTTLLLMWCLKQLKDFILKFSISGTFFLQLVHCNTCFFPFRWMCWWGCQQWSKLLQIQIRYLFPSVLYKDSNIFYESWRTLVNVLQNVEFEVKHQIWTDFSFCLQYV